MFSAEDAQNAAEIARVLDDGTSVEFIEQRSVVLAQEDGESPSEELAEGAEMAHEIEEGLA